ncbi:hypothetical protein B0H11DRAFT_2189158 [Mycena galericulata]|nr:hypothetical protein B0H11DRAFT_2189158 [Mycena galericulata]
MSLLTKWRVSLFRSIARSTTVSIIPEVYGLLSTVYGPWSNRPVSLSIRLSGEMAQTFCVGESVHPSSFDLTKEEAGFYYVAHCPYSTDQVVQLIRKKRKAKIRHLSVSARLHAPFNHHKVWIDVGRIRLGSSGTGPGGSKLLDQAEHRFCEFLLDFHLGSSSRTTYIHWVAFVVKITAPTPGLHTAQLEPPMGPDRGGNSRV